jgi:hypothetical protein
VAVSRARQLIKEVKADKGSAIERWDNALTKTAYPSAALAEVFASLHASRQYPLAVEGLLSAIRNKQGHPWMYAMLPMEMKLAEWPQEEIDRALLSRVDFATNDLSQILITASLLSRLKSWDQAIALCKEATDRDPWVPEVWLKARTIADRSGDPKHVLWTRTGILNHVWNRDADDLHKEAEQTIRDLLVTAKKNDLPTLAHEIDKALHGALAWDLMITAQWAGDGDVDMVIHEPNELVCDRRNQITDNGGLLTHMSGGGKGRKKEEYRCQEAPTGDYEVVLRLIGGRVITGKVLLRITHYSGTDKEQTDEVRVPVGETDGRVKIAVSRGRG